MSQPDGPAIPAASLPPISAETPRRRWLALLPLGIFLVLVGIFGMEVMSGRDPAALPSVMIDREAPAFNLAPLLDDKPGLAHGDLVGRPSLVNFFASWCAPCREEHGTLSGYAASGGVPLYGISYKDQPANAKQYLKQLGDPYSRIGVDPEGRTAIDFGVYGVPETYIVDGAGRIRYRYAGPVTPEVLQREILPRLAALEHGK